MKTNILSNINTIAELRPYACAKAIRAKEWSLACVSCPKKDDCACGSRAVELLDNQTKSTNKETPKHKQLYSAGRPSTVARIRACFAPDVRDHIQWVLDNTKIKTRKDACTTILNWIKGNPELDKELHMKERYDACKMANLIGRKKELVNAKSPNESNSDEMSVEEFLKENAEDNENDEALPQPATDVTENDEEHAHTANASFDESSTDDVLLSKFNTKRVELVGKLKEAVAQMNSIRRNIAALDEAAKLFGMEMHAIE